MQSRLKVDVAGFSSRTTPVYGHTETVDHFSSNTDIASRKGRLFVLADSKTRAPEPGDAGSMAIDLVQENYFTYPSSDIAFCLQRALDTANRRIYQFAQTNGLHRKIGTTCSALVITDKTAFVAHVGDSRIYRISLRRIEQLTQEHTRILDMMPREEEGQEGAQRLILTRALGVKLGVKIETVNKIPVQRDEYFLMATEPISVLPEEEIQQIVLSHTPETAARKLKERVTESGAKGHLALQIVKVYQGYERRSGSVAEKLSETGSAEDIAPGSSSRLVRLLLPAALGIGLIFAFFFGSWLDLPAIARATISGNTTSNLNERYLEKSTRERLGIASQYLQKQEYEEAARIYKLVLQEEQDNVDARNGLNQVVEEHIRRGDDFGKHSNWQHALAEYRAANQLYPDNERITTKVAAAELALKPSLSFTRTSNVDRLRGLKSRPRETGLNLNKETASVSQPEMELLDSWQTPGLYSGEDFLANKESIEFQESIRIKKAFGETVYFSPEIEVYPRRLGGIGSGKYGIIFGHEFKNRNSTFYLFSVDSKSRFMLQRVSLSSIKTITEGVMPRDLNGSTEATQLRIKCLDKMVLLYANGTLLTMVSEDGIAGGIGLYADPNLNVEFSRLTVKEALK